MAMAVASAGMRLCRWLQWLWRLTGIACGSTAASLVWRPMARGVRRGRRPSRPRLGEVLDGWWCIFSTFWDGARCRLGSGPGRSIEWLDMVT
jgi:hypothetical protein